MFLSSADVIKGITKDTFGPKQHATNDKQLSSTKNAHGITRSGTLVAFLIRHRDSTKLLLRYKI